MPAAPRQAPQTRDARRELHLALKQANRRLRADQIQHRRVRRHEDVEHAGRCGGPCRRRACAAPRRTLDPLRILYPVVPHTAWNLWRDLGLAGEHGDLLDAPWPQIDPEALMQDEIELVLQSERQAPWQARRPRRRRTRRRSSTPRALPPKSRSTQRCAGEEGRRRAGKARQCGRLKRKMGPRPRTVRGQALQG